MSYGSSTYGGAAFGGNANSVNEQIFFQLIPRPADVLFEATAVFNGPEELYSVFTRQGSEAPSSPSGVTYKIYTAHDEGETPQLQTTVEGNGQAVIGSARLITVTVIIDGTIWTGIGGQDFEVKGRPGS